MIEEYFKNLAAYNQPSVAYLTWSIEETVGPEWRLVQSIKLNMKTIRRNSFTLPINPDQIQKLKQTIFFFNSIIIIIV